MSRKKTHKSVYFLFGNNISKIASENGGKYKLAETLGVVYDSVRRWCNGENLPDGKTLLAIKEKFGVSIDWLLADQGQQQAPMISEVPPSYASSADQQTLKEILASGDAEAIETIKKNLSFTLSCIREKSQNKPGTNKMGKHKAVLEEKAM